jgi:putative transposase
MTASLFQPPENLLGNDGDEVYRKGLLTAVQKATAKLPKLGLNYVTEAVNGPSRRTESSVASSAGRYPSRKLGVTVGFDSATLELPTIMRLERSDEVIAYFDQAPCISLRAKSKSGRTVGYEHRADFLVVQSDRAYLLEVKANDGIDRKNEKNPGFYVWEQGRWTCPSGREEAARYGLGYEMWTEADFDPVELRNIRVLDRYLSGDRTHYSGQVDALRTYLDERGRSTITAAIADLSGALTVDGTYSAVAQGEVAFDMRSALLSSPRTCFLYRDQATMDAFRFVEEGAVQPDRGASGTDDAVVSVKPGDEVVWYGKHWKCLGVDQGSILWSKDSDIQRTSVAMFLMMVRTGEMTLVVKGTEHSKYEEAAKVILAARESSLAIANSRRVMIDPYLAEGAKAPAHRSISRYLCSFRRAQMEYGNGYVGLIPRHSASGNRVPRLFDPVLQIVERWVNERYLSPSRPSRSAVHRLIIGECKEKGHRPPCYSWFCKQIDGLPRFEVELARKGRKGAYRYEPRVQCADHRAAPIATRPFEHVHIDHTVMDLVVCAGGKSRMRVWITVMIDSFSRRILAFSMSFEAPSYRQVMLVMRDCVRRHGRLPERIVVDGGKEFSSTWMETTCGIYGVIVQRRPKSKARFGAEMERLFGTLNCNMLHFLTGNTQNTRDPRQLTKEVDPYRLAIWDAESLKRRLEDFFFEAYDTTTHTTLLCSPRQTFESGLERQGSSPHRLVRYDELFLIMTSATTNKGKNKGRAKVQVDGVKINYLYYNHPRLSAHLGQSVPVRFDAFNLANAWAQVDGGWVKLSSRYASVLMNYSEHDVGIATEAWRSRRSEVEAEHLGAPQLIEFLQRLTEDESLLEERERSRAERELRAADVGVDGRGNLDADAAPSDPAAAANRTANDKPPPRRVSALQKPFAQFEIRQMETL